MRTRIVVLIGLIGIVTGAEAGQNPRASASVLLPKTYRILDINRIALGISDRGNLDDSPFRGYAGYVWGLDSSRGWRVVYDHGPWIIGKTDAGLVMGNTYWGTSYMPGPIIDGRPALDVRPQDSLRYHPYKVSRTSPANDPDLTSWPTDLGAPSRAPGIPAMLGDQMIWTVFNGADSTARPSDWQRTATFTHVPVEIQQTIYAHEGEVGDTSLLANCAFLEWTFINKGSASIESCYVGLWADIDLWSLCTPFGVDTSTQTGYCWEYINPPDSTFRPKAAGYSLLYGPRVPDPISTALFRGRQVPGYRNLPMSSFWGIRVDYGPPYFWPVGPNTVTEAWNLARGFDKSGEVIIDSVTGQPTTFPWSGDPVTGAGWVYKGWTEFEGGFMFFTGPFTFAPGDTQWTLIALHPGAAVTDKEAITAVRHNAARLRALTYDEITAGRPLDVASRGKDLPLMPGLGQNYPNPFNPQTVIPFQLPVDADVRLELYDILGREVVTLVNEKRNAGAHEVVFDASDLSSGVYLYRLQVRYSDSGPTLRGGAPSYTETRRLIILH